MGSQYLGTIDDTSFGGTLARSFMDQMEKQRQEKLAMAQSMIASGQYQPTAPGQGQQGFGQRLLGGMMGPNIGGQNMNMLGQNYQYMSPQDQAKQQAAIQAQNIKATMEAVQGMSGNTPASVDSSGGVSMTYDPLELQKKQADIQQKQLEIKQLTDNQGLDQKSKQLELQKKQLELNQLQLTPEQKSAAMQGMVKQLSTPQQQFTPEFTINAKGELETKLKPKDSTAIGGLIDYSQNPEDIQKNTKEKMPGLYKFAEAVKNGDMSLRDVPGYGKNSQVKLAIDQYLASAYPGVNPDQRKKTKLDYSPGGSVGKQLTSAGTIVQHLSKIREAIKGLNNTGNVALNMAGQTLARTGAGNLTDLRKYEFMRKLLADEYETYLRNGGGAESGIERLIETMGEADPKDVQLQLMNEASSAMGGRLGRFVDGWTSVFNRSDDPKIPSTILSAKTREALKNMGMADVIKAVESPEGITGIEGSKQGTSEGSNVDYKSKYGLE